MYLILNTEKYIYYILNIKCYIYGFNRSTNEIIYIIIFGYTNDICIYNDYGRLYKWYYLLQKPSGVIYNIHTYIIPSQVLNTPIDWDPQSWTDPMLNKGCLEGVHYNCNIRSKGRSYNETWMFVLQLFTITYDVQLLVSTSFEQVVLPKHGKILLVKRHWYTYIHISCIHTYIYIRMMDRNM